VTIQLNGEAFEVRGPVTISALLDLLDIDSRSVAVEHNLIVVKRDAYGRITVNDRDQVEIVNLVGGG
jgi:thiamine biosynthesis protein ThiS